MDFPIRSKIQALSDPESDVRIILGLDWGTTYTAGVAACTTHSLPYLPKLEVRAFRQYSGASGKAKNRSNTEIPTCIRYGKDHISIGIEAERCEEIGGWLPGASMLRQLKIFLDQRPEFEHQRLKFLGALPAGKSVDDVVRDFFRELFKDWNRELRRLGCPDGAIWEINCAVPAAWKTTRPVHRLSNAILKAGEECGIKIEKRIRFCLEPVAAAAYLAQDDMMFRHQMKPDMVIAVCDCGGGTTDVTICRVESLSANEFREVVPTRGTPYGSENIDELFEEQVRARLSSLPETERIATGAGLPFLFNRFNKRIKVAFTGEDDFFRLHLSGLPHDVSKDFDQNFLRIRRRHLLEIFDQILEKIWKLIEQQIRCASSTIDESAKNYSVEGVLLIGGFSANEYLRKYLIEKLESLATQLRVTEIALYPYSLQDYAIGKGALYCSQREKVTIRRVNRCSVGLLQYEGWDRNLPGHPQEPPEPDPVTGELLVENCVKLIWRKGEEEVDPEPCRLFRSFNIEEDTVGLSVDLYSFEENKEDSYTIDHECNQDRQLWESIEFKVDVSSFKHTLNVYDAENPDPNSTLAHKPRKAKARKKDSGDIQSSSGPLTRSKGRAMLTDKGVGYAQPMAVNKCRSKKSQQERTSSRNVTAEGQTSGKLHQNENNGALMKDVGDENHRQWHTIEFVFSMERDGGLGCWTVECVDAPSDQRLKHEGTVNMTWMHEAGTSE